jgi:two-component system sensor histidine kinase PilS (NtrC family)
MTAAPRQDRRRGDRRQTDRRRSRSDKASAWLSAWGVPAGAAGSPDTLLADTEAIGDSRFIAREARRLVSTEGAALPRILRTYVLARAALGLLLVLVLWAAVLLGGKPPLPMLVLCLIYAAQAISAWVLRTTDAGPSEAPERLTVQQWAWTIGLDLLTFSALRLMDSSGQVNFAALLVLPVLMGGLLTRRQVALGTAAASTLVLLTGAWLARAERSDAFLPLTEAGLAGAGMFVIALLSSELSQRLAGEERSARSSLALARQQTQLNRLVIEEMSDGVLVVDRHGKVRAVNPAAHVLLGGAPALVPQQALGDIDGLASLNQAMQRAYDLGTWPDDARELTVPTADGAQRTLQVRARFTRRSGIGDDATGPEDVCVLFIEDLRIVQARARQDKLAAMGRMSAGIAHEIRNPLAAIAQANALMLEGALVPPQRRLADIVEANVGRLKRIVDDVLAVAGGPVPDSVPLDAAQLVAATCAEWLLTAPADLRAAGRLSVTRVVGTQPVLFDAEHLRRVLVNLLDNAARHAGPVPGAIQVEVSDGEQPGAAMLRVASDGAPIAPEVERHLFEPFFSTRSQGSGLGLYICRELCARHGASIDYLARAPGDRHRNEFRVVMRRPKAPA